MISYTPDAFFAFNPVFTWVYFAILALGMVFTVLFLKNRTVNVTSKTVLSKAKASVMFVILGVFAYFYSRFSTVIFDGSFSADKPLFSSADFAPLFVIIGFCFGMLGDIWLDLRYVVKDREQSDNFTNAGFYSFLIGHLFFSAFMLFYYEMNYLYAGIFFAVGAVITAIFVATTEKLLKVEYGKFKKITVIYMAVIGGTVGLSLYSAITAGFSGGSLLFFIGMLFFIGSDALLAGIYFGVEEKARTSHVSIVLNHTLYYIGQYLIAASLLGSC